MDKSGELGDADVGRCAAAAQVLQLCDDTLQIGVIRAARDASEELRHIINRLSRSAPFQDLGRVG